QVSGHGDQWLGEGALTAEYCHDRTGQESTIGGVCSARAEFGLRATVYTEAFAAFRRLHQLRSERRVQSILHCPFRRNTRNNTLAGYEWLAKPNQSSQASQPLEPDKQPKSGELFMPSSYPVISWRFVADLQHPPFQWNCPFGYL